MAKKKAKKNIAKGVAYVAATFNNTVITVTDEMGNVLAWSSAGALGFKGSKKSTPSLRSSFSTGPLYLAIFYTFKFINNLRCVKCSIKSNLHSSLFRWSTTVVW